MEQKLEYIDVALIDPHPDNPRKDLGDLTELADSIKKNGVMQNLTVVKRYGEISGEWTGAYTVIIGHRRLAAAKLAGLGKVPCVIVDLTLEQQIATMLLENMQRSDLSVYEQAQGFQMMINMGETVASVADRTGFSQSTVRRRMKLLDLDQDEFKKSCERGATLQDYIELDKIEDPDLKNEVLASVGTNNFKYKLSNALETEKARAWVKECVDVLVTFAEEAKVEEGEILYQKYRYVRNFNQWNKSRGLPEIPEDSKDIAYFYHISADRKEVDLYKERAEMQKDTAEDEAAARKREEEERRIEELKDIRTRAYQLRKQFVEEVSNSTAKQCIGDIIAFSARILMDSYSTIREDDFLNLLGAEIPENEETDSEDYSQFYEKINRTPEKTALFMAYSLSVDSEREGYVNWNGEKINNDELDALYTLLEKLGYEMSDEEKQMQNGTHPLFTKNGGQTDDKA